MMRFHSLSVLLFQPSEILLTMNIIYKLILMNNTQEADI